MTDYLQTLAYAGQRCECCQRKLHPERIRWLELNCRTGAWADPDKAPWPDAESQGLFPFGLACAKRILKEQSK